MLQIEGSKLQVQKVSEEAVEWMVKTSKRIALLYDSSVTIHLGSAEVLQNELVSACDPIARLGMVNERVEKCSKVSCMREPLPTLQTCCRNGSSIAVDIERKKRWFVPGKVAYRAFDNLIAVLDTIWREEP